MSEYDFIELIKRKRLIAHISMKALAKKIPICASGYCKIETHHQKLNYFIIRRLGEIWDLDLNLLKDSTPNIHPSFD